MNEGDRPKSAAARGPIVAMAIGAILLLIGLILIAVTVATPDQDEEAAPPEGERPADREPASSAGGAVALYLYDTT